MCIIPCPCRCWAPGPTQLPNPKAVLTRAHQCGWAQAVRAAHAPDPWGPCTAIRQRSCDVAQGRASGLCPGAQAANSYSAAINTFYGTALTGKPPMKKNLVKSQCVKACIPWFGTSDTKRHACRPEEPPGPPPAAPYRQPRRAPHAPRRALRAAAAAPAPAAANPLSPPTWFWYSHAPRGMSASLGLPVSLCWTLLQPKRGSAACARTGASGAGRAGCRERGFGSEGVARRPRCSSSVPCSRPRPVQGAAAACCSLECLEPRPSVLV